MNNYRPTAQAGRKQERNYQPNLAAACIETVQEAAKWLYHLVYESLLAMTAMCSSKSSSDHGRIRTETKSSWFCMVGPRQAVYMVTAVLVHLAYLVSYYLRWQLYSAIPQFPVFWPSEMTSATFCESSPTVQS